MPDHDLLATLLPIETDRVEATEAFGERLAAALAPGDVLALHGDLGAGKTHLVRGLARGLGADADGVTSPTFTLAHEYVGATGVLYHLDLYRIERPEELDAIGFDEYLAADGICAIEWPERAGARLPADALHLRLTALGGDRRRIERLDERQG